jgi:hypothetical protein
MPIPFQEADLIFRSEKRLVPPCRWEPIENREKKEEKRRLETRIEMGGGIRRGIWFRAMLFPRYLNTACFQLECQMPDRRQRVTLYRFEWNPIQAHTNKMYGPPEVNGLYIGPGQTHEHSFYDGLKDDGELRSQPDEQAREVRDRMPDFGSGLAYVCSRINVMNGDAVPLPGDQGFLL